MVGSKKHILLVDNYDSFTWNIWDYLSRAGAKVVVYRRNVLSPHHLDAFDGVVFSPGPGNPTEMADLLTLVGHSVQHKPTFGICLGFQALAAHYGAKVMPGLPTHGKVSTIEVVRKGRLFANLPDTFSVTRYHSLIVSQLGEPLVALAFALSGELMAFEHSTLPVAAVQFHPEAHLSQFGIEILKNWLDLC